MVIAVWFAFPDLRSSLTQGLTQSANGKAVSASQAAARSTTASLRPRVSPTPGNGTGGPGSSGQPGQSHSAAGSQKGNHSASPSGPPGKSGKPSPSSPAPPAGYIWRVIPASVSGAVAGIQVATPAGWAMTAPGQVTRVTAPGDGTSLTFNLRSFALTPLAEATARESAALLSGAFPGYHLISLGTVSYRGFAAASWRFRWQPKGSPYEMYATELFFIAPVSAGPLPCVMSITVPGAALAAANSVLTVAKQTFKTLP